VSRIFDALRRSEQVKNPPATRPNGEQVQDVLRSFESRPEFLEGIERKVCRPHAEGHVLSVGRNGARGQEEFRLLCHRLERIRQDQALSKILVSSAIPAEGKTLVAVNLAATLAQRSPSVLLIDGDLRHRGVHRLLGLERGSGLADFLEGRIGAAAVFQCIDPLGLYYIPAGHSSINPAELLQKPKLRELIGMAVAEFAWIVIDSPPLNLFADAHCLSTLADGVMLVVREGLTSKNVVEEAKASLAGAFIAGVVVNGSTTSNYKYGLYESYGSARAAVPTQAASSSTSGSSSSGK